MVNCAVGDPVAGSPAATLSTPTVQPFALLRSKNTLASMPVSKKPPEITTVPGGQARNPEPTPPGTIVKGADVMVLMSVPTTPLNFASACLDLRSAFFAVFRALFARLTGTGGAQSAWAPGCGDRGRQDEDYDDGRYRERHEPAHFFSLSLADCNLLGPQRANDWWGAGRCRSRPNHLRSTASGKSRLDGRTPPIPCGIRQAGASHDAPEWIAERDPCLPPPVGYPCLPPLSALVLRACTLGP